MGSTGAWPESRKRKSAKGGPRLLACSQLHISEHLSCRAARRLSFRNRRDGSTCAGRRGMVNVLPLVGNNMGDHHMSWRPTSPRHHLASPKRRVVLHAMPCTFHCLCIPSTPFEPCPVITLTSDIGAQKRGTWNAKKSWVTLVEPVCVPRLAYPANLGAPIPETKLPVGKQGPIFPCSAC